MTKTQSVSLLVSAGDGPTECNQAVAHILTRMEQDADDLGLGLDIHRTMGRDGPKSAVVVVHGVGRQMFVNAWVGTIKWRMTSQIRRNHKRSNWFVGVFNMGLDGGQSTEVRQQDVSIATLRAGGPGGQHQNTTDSAVRATHRPTGLSVVVREERSQHRNKALAFGRLQCLLDAQASAERETRKTAMNRLHHDLERGNPLREFVGPNFRERKI